MPTEDFLKDTPTGDLGVTEAPANGARPGGASRGRPPLRMPIGFTLRDAVRLLFKHKWTVLIPFVLVSGAGITYSLRAEEWYSATARIQIIPNPLQDILPGGSASLYYRDVLADQVRRLSRGGLPC